MTTDTLIFKQANTPNQPFLLAVASRFMRGFLQRITVANQEVCQIRQVNTPGENIIDVLGPRADGEIIFNLLAGSAYPIRKQF